MSTGPVRTLVLPPYATSTASLLAGAARRRGLLVEVLPGGGVPPGLRVDRPALYAARLFGDLVGPALGLGLLEPPPDWLVSLPVELTGRSVEVSTLGEAYALRRPVFVKPLDGKSFPPRVVPDGSYLPGPDALDGGTGVLVSERLVPLEEFRLFVLDGVVHASSSYARDGRLAVRPVAGHPLRGGLEDFADRVLELVGSSLPSAVVVDVGTVLLPNDPSPSWVVVEANAAWSSGCYAADPDRVLDVVLRSGGPLDLVSARDRPFLRPSR